MPRTTLFLLFIGLGFAASGHSFAAGADALSPEAEQGKALYPSCDVCHDQGKLPALGPPMWGVQRKYKRDTADKAEFVQRMSSFVKAPSLDTAIHDEALSQLGLMPAMPLPDEFLNKISTYIFEENFAPPCEHWKYAIEKAREAGNVQHAAKDQRQLDKFCQ